jgi:superfamily II DNA or RNA helicase
MNSAFLTSSNFPPPKKKKMSLRVPLLDLKEEDIEAFEKHLLVEETSRQNKQRQARCPWLEIPKYNTVRRDDDHAYLPFQWGVNYFSKKYRTERSDCSPIKIAYVGVLREEQKVVLQETTNLLNRYGSCMMAMYPGGGKTMTSLALASVIGLRTLILVNKIVLVEQWLDTIHRAFGDHVRVQNLKPSGKIQPGCQFYIMNALNVPKRDAAEYARLGIGFVIVDECHLIMTKVFSKAMAFLCPRYLIGLSATPFRPDGFDVMLELYFGLKKVVRKLYRPHQVLLWETKIKIVAKKDARGQILWCSVIDAQTAHAERNARIVDACVRHADRNILVLCKRIQQIDTLLEGLREKGQAVTCMKDNDVTFDKEARILVATYQKVGTGFSHDKLDMLILATDAEEYFIQYLGRVFRRPDVNPIVLDIVDDHPILRRHFLTRRKVYHECGGAVEDYKPV